jgi:hypothetical protein
VGRRLAAALPAARVSLDIADAPTPGAGTLVALLPAHGPVAHLRAVVEAMAGRPGVVVLGGGSTEGVEELPGSAAALLLCWEDAAERPAALAAVLSGRAEPGGRLPLGPVGSGHRLPLGHGRGYTDFEYSDLDLPAQLPTTGEPLRVGCVVTNTGRRVGKEVVQVYLHHLLSPVTTPERGLGGFAVVRVPAGGSVRVEVLVPVERFAVWNRTMHRAVEPGEFDVAVGRSATDVRLSGRTSAPSGVAPSVASRSEHAATPFG